MFLRDSVHEVGARVLERVLNRERGAEAAVVKCAAGHEAALVDYRSKRVARKILHSADQIRRAARLQPEQNEEHER